MHRLDFSEFRPKNDSIVKTAILFVLYFLYTSFIMCVSIVLALIVARATLLKTSVLRPPCFIEGGRGQIHVGIDSSSDYAHARPRAAQPPACSSYISAIDGAAASRQAGSAGRCVSACVIHVPVHIPVPTEALAGCFALCDRGH